MQLYRSKWPGSSGSPCSTEVMLITSPREQSHLLPHTAVGDASAWSRCGEHYSTNWNQDWVFLHLRSHRMSTAQISVTRSLFKTAHRQCQSTKTYQMSEWVFFIYKWDTCTILEVKLFLRHFQDLNIYDLRSQRTAKLLIQKQSSMYHLNLLTNQKCSSILIRCLIKVIKNDANLLIFIISLRSFFHFL